MPCTRRRVSLPTRTLIEFALSSPSPPLTPSRPHRGDDLLRAVCHGGGGLDREPALAQDLAPQLHVRALEAHDEGHLEPQLPGRGHDAVRDDVALHDAAEDVDEDR